MSETEIPTDLNKLRSCIACGLIQTTDYWEATDSCPNCQIPFISQKYQKYTSASFTGVIAIFDPQKSWCASWERFHTNIPGMYALHNEGEVTEEILTYLAENQRPLPEWVEDVKLRNPNAD